MCVTIIQLLLPKHLVSPSTLWRHQISLKDISMSLLSCYSESNHSLLTRFGHLLLVFHLRGQLLVILLQMKNQNLKWIMVILLSQFLTVKMVQSQRQLVLPPLQTSLSRSHLHSLFEILNERTGFSLLTRAMHGNSLKLPTKQRSLVLVCILCDLVLGLNLLHWMMPLSSEGPMLRTQISGHLLFSIKPVLFAILIRVLHGE
jgi:hypothetical protein